MIKYETVMICTCDCCGYVWRTRTERAPISCAKCRNTRWNKNHSNTEPAPVQQPVSKVPQTSTIEDKLFNEPEVDYSEDFGA